MSSSAARLTPCGVGFLSGGSGKRQESVDQYATENGPTKYFKLQFEDVEMNIDDVFRPVYHGARGVVPPRPVASALLKASEQDAGRHADREPGTITEQRGAQTPCYYF